ncbi:uncharacterized protein EV422DRAFT_594792 [Fimicolochytrium jonesii]|uniref:uncharacterized protein n=1 Tax=Fimicolochytrium jonesii TaxID=1396493 RepID=UPI0022FE04A7|nr:uncharacterized protein EV422DRAFT_594792 [Fimicolochytrium jonesii]KAI8821391.1 hypothetical protein EV422DRAFT_594792 [Fimicolochytrium jonesii]
MQLEPLLLEKTPSSQKIPALSDFGGDAEEARLKMLSTSVSRVKENVSNFLSQFQSQSTLLKSTRNQLTHTSSEFKKLKDRFAVQSSELDDLRTANEKLKDELTQAQISHKRKLEQVEEETHKRIKRYEACMDECDALLKEVMSSYKKAQDEEERCAADDAVAQCNVEAAGTHRMLHTADGDGDMKSIGDEAGTEKDGNGDVEEEELNEGKNDPENNGTQKQGSEPILVLDRDDTPPPATDNTDQNEPVKYQPIEDQKVVFKFTQNLESFKIDGDDEDEAEGEDEDEDEELLDEEYLDEEEYFEAGEMDVYPDKFDKPDKPVKHKHADRDLRRFEKHEGRSDYSYQRRF